MALRYGMGWDGALRETHQPDNMRLQIQRCKRIIIAHHAYRERKHEG